MPADLTRTGTISNRPGTYNWTAEYGGIPTVPSPTATARSALTGNITNLPYLEELASGVNVFNTEQMQQAMESLVPNYAALRQTQSGNIGSELAGQLPQDVINLIAQQAAERGVASGIPGSPNANAALLRAMGLSSLNLTEMGAAGLQRAIGETYMPQFFDLNRMLVNPEDVQGADVARNIYASMPDPKAAAEAAIAAVLAGEQYGQPRQGGTNWATVSPSGSGGQSTDWFNQDWYSPGIVGPFGSEAEPGIFQPDWTGDLATLYE